MDLIYQFALLTVFVAIASGSCGRSSAALPERHVRPWDNGFIGFGALLVFLVVPYCLIPFGMDFTDTPWHIRNFPRYTAYPMTALSYFLADRFTALMGNEVITTRALTVLLMQVTILLPFLTLVPWRAHRVATSVLLAVLGLLLSVKSSPVLGWDSFSGLFLMGASVCLLSYLRTGRCVTLVLFGFLSGLAICSRLPNVVIIFVGVLLITSARVLIRGCDRSHLARRLARDNGLFLLAAIATVLIVAYLLYGSVQEYFSSAFSMISISNSEEHDLKAMIHGYAWSLWSLLREYGVIMSFAVFLQVVYGVERLRHYHPLVRSVCFTLLLVYVLMMDDAYHFMLTDLLTGFVLFLLSLGVYDELRNTTGYHVTFLSAAILLFSLIPTAGSNTGLLKVSAIYFLPVILFAAWKQLEEWGKDLSYIFLVATVAYLPFSLVQRTYEDAGVLQTTARVDHKKLNHILTTPVRAAFIQNVVQDVEALKSKGIDYVLTGQCRCTFLFEYLSGFNRLPFHGGSFRRRPEDSKYVAEIMQFLRDRRQTYVIVIADYPEQLVDAAVPSRLEPTLRDGGYAVFADRPGYRIFRPKL